MGEVKSTNLINTPYCLSLFEHPLVSPSFSPLSLNIPLRSLQHMISHFQDIAYKVLNGAWPLRSGANDGKIWPPGFGETKLDAMMWEC